MLRSEIFLPTLRETPESAEIPSHIFSIRAGLIRQLSRGIYTYLPLGFRMVKKIIRIIREEMNSVGAQEIMLPFILPRELWESTGRWEEFGPEMMRLKDRKGGEYSLAPTHEEAITHLVMKEISSYRDLPLILYQIQPKFRDEPRPRFGLLRARQFIMKDAYSFHVDEEDLEKTYQNIKEAYQRIFSRCGIEIIVVEGDPGLMGGKISHEFMAPAEYGEDVVVTCPSCGYAANRELAETIPLLPEKNELSPLQKVHTPDSTTIEEVSTLLKIPPHKLVKTLILDTDKGPIACLLRGDHELNLSKVKKLLSLHRAELADEELIQRVTGGPLGFSGPVGLKIDKIIADYRVKELRNFVTGANEKDYHFINVNIDRDFTVDMVGDLRYITPEDPCPRCKKQDITFQKCIEVGHIFKLGTRYTQPMKAFFQDREGKNRPFVMGCYGIGVDRIWISAIEQKHDKFGLIFPFSIAPFQVIILPLNFSENKIKHTSLNIYHSLRNRGWEVLLDDRDERAGVKFKDADLIGIPYQIILGERYLREEKIELKIRETGEKLEMEVERGIEWLETVRKGSGKKSTS